MFRFYSVAVKAMILLVLLASGGELYAQYCRPTQPAQAWTGTTFISGVTIGSNYSRTSGVGAGGYEYLTSTGAPIPRGANVNVTIQMGTAFFGVSYSVWLDVNQDGLFAPTERLVCILNGGATATFTMNLPCDTRIGRTRMRIMTASYYGGMPCPTDPCQLLDFNYPDCEDHDVDILGSFSGTSFPNDTPDSSAILVKGNIYDGLSANRPAPMIAVRASQAGQSTQLQYRIFGPLPSTDTVYSASWTFVAPSAGIFNINPPTATGRLAGPGNALNTTNAIGGEYALLVRAPAAPGSACPDEYSRAFTIAVQRDISTRQIRSPQNNDAPRRFKYPNTTQIPVEAVFQNSGLDTVKNFRARVMLYAPSGAIEYADTVNVVDPLASTVRLTQTFANFIPSPGGHPVGIHRAVGCADLVDPFPDENSFNDCFPRPGSPNLNFEIGYNEEPAVSSVNVPVPNPTNLTQVLIQGRSFRPEGIFENNGIQDLSNVPVRLIITKLPQNTVVYNQTGIVPDIAAGQFNKAIFTFPTFTPVEGGDYRFCFRVEYPGDPVTTNNEICITRNVEANFNGTYTIGSTVTGPRNFPTIDSALNALYFRGVSGPVVFEFTDNTYTVTKVGVATPAIDLSSRIIGVSATNTITFRPSTERSISKGAVTINMETQSGLGVLFGQNTSPSNLYAIQRAQYFANAQNANSAGNITFDGGIQKALRFTMRKTTTTSPFVSVFYLSSGSSNISIQNVLVENATGVTPTYATSLPQVQFNSGSNQYRFETNTRNNTVSFTAGIVNRDTINPDNLGNLDTLINTNNKFIGNEINGFGYGIVSIGIGSLIKSGINEFRPYYNAGTEIRDNLIFNVRRAGIFAAYEDGAQITGNRIYNVGAVTGGTPTDASGILAGGELRYNNMNLFIARNEISGVSASAWVRGITVEQARNDYQSVAGGSGSARVLFPNKAERTYVTSNMVWGLTRTGAAANVAGIHLYTRRVTSSVPTTALLTPNTVEYFTAQDSVVNNTVVITADGLSGTGALVGVGLQNANAPVVMNNALAMLTDSNTAAITNSAIFYQGTIFRNGRVNTWYLPTTAPGALISNKNAFWTPNAGIGRVVEVSHVSELVSAGSQTEFATLAQWRNWTGQDINSPYGNFVADHAFVGTAPNQSLRVVVTPQVPIGSILNNNGERLSGTKLDVENNIRGEAGLGYDIGADEFNGRLYVSDLEVIDVLSPAAYRDAVGPTSDAEYIMTTAPVDVRARVRNNGALATTRSRVRVRVFIETPASNNAVMNPAQYSSFPLVDRVITTSLTSGQSKDIQFAIPSWSPQPYLGMTGYNVPAQFASMSANVTPRYRVEVSVDADEFNNNNVFAKDVRFFIRKSTLRLLLSVEGTNLDILSGTPTQNQIAARLNADSVQKAFGDLGYINDPSNGRFDFDVLDRYSWATRSVDYTMYQTIFWGQDLNPLTRSERDDIRNYIAAGQPGMKKNFAMSASTVPSQHNGASIVSDLNFVQTTLRCQLRAPGTPFSPTYSGRNIDGRAIARGNGETVVRTGFAGDAEPTPALVSMYSDGTTSGVVNAAYTYRRADRSTPNDSIMGTATAGITANSVYLGVDWRHFARSTSATVLRTGIERVVRGILDFFETNGGGLVPVQLTSFDAKARGKNVDVFWSTASEEGLRQYEVERASVNNVKAGDITGDAFSVVRTVEANGSSTTPKDYSITDEKLVPGTYTYRLTTVDKDGARSTSENVNVTIDGEGSGLWINTIAPNPVVDGAVVSFGMETAGLVEVIVVNSAGQEVGTLLSETLTAGEHTVRMSAAQLASGSYTLIVRSNGFSVSSSVTVTK
ncbi:MAG: hypothetical protein FGM32_03350 [Candidatus Kapabacteria bacterium]|nr:hypothetical protein [Candidatus Kapabacteria bacterium]